MAVVINDFEVIPGGVEEPTPPPQENGAKGGGDDVEKRFAEWLAKHKDRSLRNWAH